jgi:hypothetical protein
VSRGLPLHHLRRPLVNFKQIATIAVVSLLTTVAYDAYKAKKA